MSASRPPQEALASSDDVARVLRDHPPVLNEMTQARLERALMAGESVSGSRSHPRSWAPLKAGGLVVGALAAAAALIFWVWPIDEAPPVARFEVLESQATARRGTLEEGSVLPTGPSEEADIRVGDSRVHIAASSRVRIAALTPTQLDLSLGQGEVRVEFHPRERGREHLTVETPEARVEVVGTVFRVETHDGVTDVSVEEGVVRVVPRRGAASEVRAGEHVRVGEALAGTPTASSEMLAEATLPGEAAVPSEAAVPADSEEGIAPSAEGEQEVEAAGVSQGVPAEPRPATEAPEDVLARAQSLVLEGDSEAATPLLARLTRRAPRHVQARAWTLLADLAQRDGRLGEAAEAFSRAADLGRGTPTGPNAVYALARLHERRGDSPAAVRSYTRYLEAASSGPLASQARQALCRLGEASWCAP